MKENKFLTGFAIVTLVGVLALGFMLFRAKGRFSDAYDIYTAKVGDLQTLQGSRPYPDDNNFKRMLELQKAHQEAINNLQSQLAKAELPVEPISPEKFQDNLRSAIKRVRTLAAQKGTTIGDSDQSQVKFSLGFEIYESQPPKPEAAAPLGRMLAAIEIAVTELLNTSPTKLLPDIKRTPLPEEGIAQKGAPATPPPQTRPVPGGKPLAEAKPLVQRHPFEISFVAQEPKVRTFINKIVANKQQFYIPAGVAIANEALTGPSKSAGAEPPPPPPAPIDPNAPPVVPPVVDPNAPLPEAPAPPPTDAPKFIVGEEKLQVTMRIEVVDFAEPPVSKPAESPKKPAK